MSSRSRLIALCVWWVVGSSIAGTVGWALAASSGLFTMGLSLILSGAIVGLLVGGAQELVLQLFHRNYANEQRTINWDQPFDWEWHWDKLNWVAFTTVGGGTSFVFAISMQLVALSFGPILWRQVVSPLLVYSIAGVIYGSVQWLILRRTIQNSIWWIPASGFGWGLGAAVALYIGGMLPGRETGLVMGPDNFMWSFIVGGVATIVASIVTGIVLVLLLHISSTFASEGLPKSK